MCLGMMESCLALRPSRKIVGRALTRTKKRMGSRKRKRREMMVGIDIGASDHFPLIHGGKEKNQIAIYSLNHHQYKYHYVCIYRIIFVITIYTSTTMMWCRVLRSSPCNVCMKEKKDSYKEEDMGKNIGYYTGVPNHLFYTFLSNIYMYFL